jgi:hypothetical protein
MWATFRVEHEHLKLLKKKTPGFLINRVMRKREDAWFSSDNEGGNFSEEEEIDDENVTLKSIRTRRSLKVRHKQNQDDPTMPIETKLPETRHSAAITQDSSIVKNNDQIEMTTITVDNHNSMFDDEVGGRDNDAETTQARLDAEIEHESESIVRLHRRNSIFDLPEEVLEPADIQVDFQIKNSEENAFVNIHEEHSIGGHMSLSVSDSNQNCTSSETLEGNREFGISTKYSVFT